MRNYQAFKIRAILTAPLFAPALLPQCISLPGLTTGNPNPAPGNLSSFFVNWTFEAKIGAQSYQLQEDTREETGTIFAAGGVNDFYLGLKTGYGTGNAADHGLWDSSLPQLGLGFYLRGFDGAVGIPNPTSIDIANAISANTLTIYFTVREPNSTPSNIVGSGPPPARTSATYSSTTINPREAPVYVSGSSGNVENLSIVPLDPLKPDKHQWKIFATLKNIHLLRDDQLSENYGSWPDSIDIPSATFEAAFWEPGYPP